MKGRKGRNRLRRAVTALALGLAVMLAPLSAALPVQAKGATYTPLEDVYYTKDNCVVYAEPTYTSTVLTTIGANVPVRVVGEYSNGWYRINIGVICYVKMDSLTTAGAIGIPTGDAQVADAQKTASEIGYKFVYLKLNNEKKIKKDIFNSYIGQKVILYAKISDNLGVSFKMLYNDKIEKDIDLNYVQQADSFGSLGERIVTYTLSDPTMLYGQMAIFQFKVGYDKAVDIFPYDSNTATYNYMNTYYTEFSEFAYAPVTQVDSMQIWEYEITNSLSNNQRNIMADHRKGIKYQADDDAAYRSTITSRLRKDTEYVDYEY